MINKMITYRQDQWVLIEKCQEKIDHNKIQEWLVHKYINHFNCKIKYNKKI